MSPQPSICPKCRQRNIKPNDAPPQESHPGRGMETYQGAELAKAANEGLDKLLGTALVIGAEHALHWLLKEKPKPIPKWACNECGHTFTELVGYNCLRCTSKLETMKIMNCCKALVCETCMEEIGGAQRKMCGLCKKRLVRIAE